MRGPVRAGGAVRRAAPAVALVCALGLAGCTAELDPAASSASAIGSPAMSGSGSASAAPGTSASPDPRSTPTVTRAIPTTPLYPDGDIDAGLAPFVEQARADLAALLGVPVADIGTHAAVLVVWPDASLGCPNPDMRYKQVPTDGSVIELSHAGTTYRYHTGGTRGPFQCPEPLTRAPGGEGAGAG